MKYKNGTLLTKRVKHIITMTPNQLFPLEVDPHTQEPFLRLRKHKNIIITPMRWEDATHFVPIFNDPRVYKWLMRTPFPYTLSK